jgi:hypothetical protein
MIRKKGFWQGLIFIFLALVLASSMLIAACGGGGGEEETPPVTAPPTATPTKTATPTATVPPPTGTPGGTIPPAPPVPAGWQTIQNSSTAEVAQAAKDFGVDWYIPGEWITMTQPGMLLSLDPTFFPGAMLSVYDVPAGTKPADMPTWVKNNIPSDKGGDTDNFKVIEEGVMTLDNGVTTPYLIYSGTKMGYTTQIEQVYLLNGTKAYVLGGDDYVPTFSDNRALIEQVIKTFHSTSFVPAPGPSGGAPTPTPTKTATPTVAPTTVAPTPTAAPTTPAPAGTGLDINSTIGQLLDNPQTKAVIDNCIPGFSTNPQVGMARGMTLPQVQPLSSGAITQAMIDCATAGLNAIK